MRKWIVSLLLILTLALSACGNDAGGTYYPTNQEMKANLENNGYFVEAYHDECVSDRDDGGTDRYSADTIRAKKDDGNYIHFFRIDKSEACEHYYNKLKKEHPDAGTLVLIENDSNFGNIVYCGTTDAVSAAGIRVVRVDADVKI